MSRNNDLMNSPEAAELLRSKTALKKLLAAPETKRLMEALSRKNGDQLTAAAKKAKAGDFSALSAMVSGLASSQEGSTLLRQMEETVQREK